MAGVLTAGDITEFRALVEELAFPDAYTLVTDTATPDDEGGWTTVEGTVEGGYCLLTAGGLNPTERVIADRQGYSAPYVAELPYATLATPVHRLKVGARTFEIGGVLKEAAWGISARLVCEERG